MEKNAAQKMLKIEQYINKFTKDKKKNIMFSLNIILLDNLSTNPLK